MIHGNGNVHGLAKPDKLSNPKQKPFFPTQHTNRVFDGLKETHEIKQSKSNGTLAKGSIASLKKNISFDKMTMKQPIHSGGNPSLVSPTQLASKLSSNTATSSFQGPSNRLLVSKESTPNKLMAKMREGKYTGLKIGTQELKPVSIRLSELHDSSIVIPRTPKSFAKVIHANKSMRSKSKQANQSEILEDYKELIVGRLSTGETYFQMPTEDHDWTRINDSRAKRSPFKTLDEDGYPTSASQVGGILPNKFGIGKTNSDYIFGHSTATGTSRLPAHRADDSNKKEPNYLTANKSSQNILNFHGIRPENRYTGLTSKYGRSTGGNRFLPEGPGKPFPSFATSGSANLLSSYSKKSGNKLRDSSVS